MDLAKRILPLLLLQYCSHASTTLTADSVAVLVAQSEQLQAFELVSRASANYFLLELEVLASTAQVALSANSGAPVTSLGAAAYVDHDAMSLNKTIHFLLIPRNGEKWFATVFNFDLRSSISYKISLTESAVAICGRRCEKGGRCSNGECFCEDGYVSEDCALQASIMSTREMTLLVPPKSWRFVTFPTYSEGSELTVSLESAAGEVLQYHRCAEKGFRRLASEELYDAYFVLELQRVSVASVDIQCQYAESSFYNSGENLWANITLTTTKGSEKQELLFVFIISGVVLGVLLFWVVFIYLKVRRGRNQMVPDTPGFSPEVIQALFPVAPFKVMGKEKQTECPICLEPFKSEDFVRSLPCRHIYHCSCIDAWLTTHKVRSRQVCCVCKQDCSITLCASEEIDTSAVVESMHAEG